MYKLPTWPTAPYPVILGAERRVSLIEAYVREAIESERRIAEIVAQSDAEYDAIAETYPDTLGILSPNGPFNPFNSVRRG